MMMRITMPRLWMLVWTTMMTTTRPTAGRKDPLRSRMGTKSVYEAFPSTTSPPPGGCGSASMVQVVARHGSRHSGHVDELNALALKLSKLSPSSPRWLREWRYPAAASQASLLTGRGLTEHYDLARRLALVAPDATPRNYSPPAYPIRSTFKSRAAQSAEAFALGALETATPPAPFLKSKVGATAFVETVDGDDDLALRFFDNCDAYDDAARRSDEYANYLKGPEIAQALAAFRRRALGGRLGGGDADDDGEDDDAPVDDVDVSDLLLAYEACAYEFILDDDDDEGRHHHHQHQRHDDDDETRRDDDDDVAPDGAPVFRIAHRDRRPRQRPADQASTTLRNVLARQGVLLNDLDDDQPTTRQSPSASTQGGNPFFVQDLEADEYMLRRHLLRGNPDDFPLSNADEDDSPYY
mmetsp:Transcript_15371/g.50275  ORF Transcript_15371/g.50275 Transcript_15371/m.50275 type:complete len:411 (-) Transcript_15371:103-1335(-)